MVVGVGYTSLKSRLLWGLSLYTSQFLLFLYLWIQSFYLIPMGTGVGVLVIFVVGGRNMLREEATGTVCGVHL